MPELSDYVPGESPVVDHHTLSVPWSGREAINVIELGLSRYVFSAAHWTIYMSLSDPLLL